MSTGANRAYHHSNLKDRKFNAILQGINQAVSPLFKNRMARAAPKLVKQKLAKSFQEIEGSTHLMFGKLVIRAETDDIETLTLLTEK